VSEVDDKGNVMSTFTDVRLSYHLSTDMTGRVLVADFWQHCILVLGNQLNLERVLVDTNSLVKPWYPLRLHLNELTSQLYILHTSREWKSGADVISQWSLR